MNNVTIERDGWFEGNIEITLPSDLNEEDFRDICDDENLSYDMAMDLSNSINGLPVASMADYIKDAIREQISIEGNTSGMIDDIEWSFDCDISVNGEDVDFWDLDEVSQDRILDNIFEGCYQGDLVISSDVEYEFKIDPIESPENEITGTLEYDIDNTYSCVYFTIDPENQNVCFEYDLPERLAELADTIESEILEAYNNEKSLDDKIAAAEARAAGSNDNKETKAHDDMEL